MLTVNELSEGFRDFSRYMASYGYVTLGFSSGPIFKIRYENAQIDRKVTFQLFNNQTMHALSFGRSKGGFLLDEFLLAKNLKVEKKKLDILNNMQDAIDRQKLEKLAKEMASIIESNLKTILDGSNWEAVPASFGNYK